MLLQYQIDVYLKYQDSRLKMISGQNFLAYGMPASCNEEKEEWGHVFYLVANPVAVLIVAQCAMKFIIVYSVRTIPRGK